MDIVEFNVPKVKLEGFQNDVVAFIAIFLTYFQLFFISEYAAEIVMKFANDLVVLLNYEPIFPAKLDTLRNAVGIDYTYKGMFRLVVCPECHTLYEPEAIHCDSRCTFSEFQAICNAQLFQSVNIGASKMYANKVSAFNSIKYALTVMFSRPGFESAIEAWRYRTRHNNTMYDIYDGQFWNEFKDRDDPSDTKKKISSWFVLFLDPKNPKTHKSTTIYKFW
ncbi:hypothetical protein G6F20_013541 [Rhizopus arrhizus]|nr:hypothetical protein G6F20_013541 [Rhizopus arrhizus]